MFSCFGKDPDTVASPDTNTEDNNSSENEDDAKQQAKKREICKLSTTEQRHLKSLCLYRNGAYNKLKN